MFQGATMIVLSGILCDRGCGESAQQFSACGSGCPELASGQSKPSRDLRFVLAEFRRLSACPTFGTEHGGGVDILRIPEGDW
jgi:hypothetical protein